MSSVKNTLQEIYQKNSLTMPKYETDNGTGPCHRPMFVSKLKLPNGDMVISDECESKKKAELNVAAKVLEGDWIKTLQDECINIDQEINFTEYSRVLFVDVENRQAESKKLASYLSENDMTNIKVYFISTEKCGVKNPIEDMIAHDHNCEYITINSRVSDAADVYIMVMATRLMEQYERMAIFSIDHFSDTFCDVMAKDFNKKNITAFGEMKKFISWMSS